MINQLSPREFEEFCQLLLAKRYDCNVVLTKATGDEGRDLIVEHPDGLIVVECKHWPEGTVGRPVVQKLHSAVLTCNSKKGMIITSGRFTQEATSYAMSLNDISMELVDVLKLDHLQQVVLPNSEGTAQKAISFATMSKNDLREFLINKVLNYSENIDSERKYLINRLAFDTVTIYAPIFSLYYSAEGNKKILGSIHRKTWEGFIFLSDGDKQIQLENPPGCGRGFEHTVSLGDALKRNPGNAIAPTMQLFQVSKMMKEHIANSFSHGISYKGKNGRKYSAQLVPTTENIRFSDFRLIYVPRRTFWMMVQDVQYSGDIDEISDDSSILVKCKTLSMCNVCKTATSGKNQIICSICFLPAHRWSILFPDSFVCCMCKKPVCRNHTTRAGLAFFCASCKPISDFVVPRWAGCLIFGLLMSLVFVAIWMFGASLPWGRFSASESYGSFGGISPWLLLATAIVWAWGPFLFMISQQYLLPQSAVLKYKK